MLQLKRPTVKPTSNMAVLFMDRTNPDQHQLIYLLSITNFILTKATISCTIGGT